MRPNDRTETRKTKRLKTKPALLVMGILLLGNLLWFIAWLIPNNAGSGEAVAEVDGDTIRHEDWVAEMESRVGRESLEALVNEKVMEAAAKKHDIDVSDEELSWLYGTADVLLHTGGHGDLCRSVPVARTFGLDIRTLPHESFSEAHCGADSCRSAATLLRFLHDPG